MNNEKKSKPKTPVNQGFAKMVPSVKKFEVMGEKVTAKVLRFNDYAVLQELFEEWQSFDVTNIVGLLNENFFTAYPAVIWLSIREHTTREDDNGKAVKIFEDLETVQASIGFDNWEEWQPIVTHATGVAFREDDDSETPVAESTEDAAPKKD